MSNTKMSFIGSYKFQSFELVGRARAGHCISSIVSSRVEREKERKKTFEGSTDTKRDVRWRCQVRVREDGTGTEASAVKSGYSAVAGGIA